MKSRLFNPAGSVTN